MTKSINTKRQIVRLSITVHGLEDNEIVEGLRHFKNELKNRPWLLLPRVRWISTFQNLAIKLNYEATDSEYAIKAVNDEMLDCIVATIKFTRDIRIEVIAIPEND